MEFLLNSWEKITGIAFTIIGGALIVKARDFILVKIIGFLNPDKYIDIIVGNISKGGNAIANKVDKIGDKLPITFEDIDVKYIEPFKAKNPEAGLLLEKKLAKALSLTGKELSKKLIKVANEIEKDFLKASDNILDK